MIISIKAELYEILIIAAFAEIVQSSNGTMHKAEDDKNLKNDNIKNPKTNKRVEKKNVSIIPSHLMKTDISGLKGKTLIFANTMFCILFWHICHHLHYRVDG
jgi:DNA ligase-4